VIGWALLLGFPEPLPGKSGKMLRERLLGVHYKLLPALRVLQASACVVVVEAGGAVERGRIGSRLMDREDQV